jgi:hypothetical protein
VGGRAPSTWNGLRAAAALVVTCGCAARSGAGAPTASVAAPAGAPPGPARATVAAPSWIRDLETELATLRALPFKRDVPFGTQSRAAFRARVHDELAHDLPAARAGNMSRAYGAMGFIPVGFDLVKAMEDAFSTDVAAYYDPKQREFEFVGSTGTSRDAAQVGTVAIHELAHALQDQNFDLLRFEGEEPAVELDDDQRLARRCVVEGEATFLMMAHEMGSGPPAARRVGPLAVAGLRMNLMMLAAADMIDLLSSMREGMPAQSLDEDERADLAAIERLPVFVTLPMIEPYFKGALFVSELWAAGGWPAVDAVYRAPPDSTEQVLHPVEKYLHRRDPPVRIRLPPEVTKAPLPGAALLVEDTAGELGWRVYFRTWKVARGDRAAAGWGGDRLWGWAIGDRTIAVAATTWDTEDDAREFVDAYEETLASRFPRRTAMGTGHGGLRVDLRGGEIVAVELRGRDVDVVSGVTERELEVIGPALRAARREPLRSAP